MYSQSTITLHPAAPEFRPAAGRAARKLLAWVAVPPNRLCDLMCLSFAMLAVVFWQPLALNGYAVGRLMGMRISALNLLAASVCLVFWNLLLHVQLVDRSYRRPWWQFAELVCQTFVCSLVAELLIFLRHPGMATLKTLELLAALSLLLRMCSRLIIGAYFNLVRPAIRRPRSVVIVGSGPRAQSLADQLRNHPRWNYRLHGFVDSDPPVPTDNLLGDVRALEAILMDNAIDEVVMALPMKSKYDDIQEAISICERVGVQSRFSTDLFRTQITKRRSIDRDDPSVVLLHMVHNETGRPVKRLLDVLVAASALLVLSPLLLVVALAIRLTSDGPVLFRQQRFGLNRRPFYMLKFRSMVVDAERRQKELEHLNEKAGPVFKIKRDPRVTRVGRIIRKTSLDELPQLWNVLKGDMSLVGPRPLPMRDVSRFSESWLMRRFSVLPGITGLWQVSGRSETSFAELIELDLDYIDRWSILLDFKILIQTVPAVLKGSGAA